MKISVNVCIICLFILLVYCMFIKILYLSPTVTVVPTLNIQFTMDLYIYRFILQFQTNVKQQNQ